MSIHRLMILMVAVMGMALTDAPSADAPMIPDGVYRDAGGVAALTIKGQTAVLETTLLGGHAMKLRGLPNVHADGSFFLSGVAMASNQYDAVFGRRRWKWETDHFVVKEAVPPGRTLQLKRQ